MTALFTQQYREYNGNRQDVYEVGRNKVLPNSHNHVGLNTHSTQSVCAQNQNNCINTLSYSYSTLVPCRTRYYQRTSHFRTRYHKTIPNYNMNR